MLARNTAVWIGLFCMIAPPSHSSDKLDAAILTPAETPKGCSAIDGKYPTDIQTAILYDRYDVYKETLPPLSGKGAQSFLCGRDKGTVYYFEYSSSADRERAGNFVRGLLWGGDHPSADHPEQIENAQNLLLILSFKKVPDTLLAAIRGKLRKDEKN